MFHTQSEKASLRRIALASMGVALSFSLGTSIPALAEEAQASPANTTEPTTATVVAHDITTAAAGVSETTPVENTANKDAAVAPTTNAPDTAPSSENAENTPAATTANVPAAADTNVSFETTQTASLPAGSALSSEWIYSQIKAPKGTTIGKVNTLPNSGANTVSKDGKYVGYLWANPDRVHAVDKSLSGLYTIDVTFINEAAGNATQHITLKLTKEAPENKATQKIDLICLEGDISKVSSITLTSEDGKVYSTSTKDPDPNHQPSFNFPRGEVPLGTYTVSFEVAPGYQVVESKPQTEGHQAMLPLGDGGTVVIDEKFMTENFYFKVEQILSTISVEYILDGTPDEPGAAHLGNDKRQRLDGVTLELVNTATGESIDANLEHAKGYSFLKNVPNGTYLLRVHFAEGVSYDLVDAYVRRGAAVSAFEDGSIIKLADGYSLLGLTVEEGKRTQQIDLYFEPSKKVVNPEEKPKEKPEIKPAAKHLKKANTKATSSALPQTGDASALPVAALGFVSLASFAASRKLSRKKN